MTPTDTTPLMERTSCEALVITCSDFRFKHAEHELEMLYHHDYDLIARPGGARMLVAPRNEASGESGWEEVRLLHRLHNFRRVVLLNHVSCRAYDDIANPDTERDVHAAHLRQAIAALEAALPVEAEAHLITLVADGAYEQWVVTR